MLGSMALADLGPALPDTSQWFQAGAMLVCVVGAVAWLTARWVIRRRSGCAGDCSRCTAHGAATEPGPCARTGPTLGGTGVRADGLRVLQGPANLPPGGGV